VVQGAEFAAGRINASSGGAGTEVWYYTRDHLGSTRLITDANGAVKERSDYYPFGLRMEGGTQASGNRWRFAGKEEQKAGITLDWLNFGARMYDPCLGRWTTQDPLAEKYPGISPYAYCAGNPMNLVDPDGRDWVYHLESQKYYWRDSIVSSDNMPEGYEYVGKNASDILTHAGFQTGYQSESYNMTGTISNDMDMLTYVSVSGDSNVIIQPVISFDRDHPELDNLRGMQFDGLDVIVNESLNVVSNSDGIEAEFKAELQYGGATIEKQMHYPRGSFISSGEINKTAGFHIPNTAVRKPKFGYSGMQIKVRGQLGIRSFAGYSPMTRNPIVLFTKVIRHAYYF